MLDDLAFEEDYEICCPECGESPIRGRSCSGLFCENGYIDESEDDPINFMPGQRLIPCDECNGTGYTRWCPNCNALFNAEHIDQH